jgi:lipopolysaccharide transport system ATP-binding protein
MKKPPIIELNGIGKKYRLGATLSHNTLRDQIAYGIRSLFDRSKRNIPARRTQEPDEIWALKDITFDVHEGEVLGIIGKNGAGKSTLLKVLSRITEPTCGNAILRGRVASLLEVGTGFHPELSGKENIYLNGAILGMTKREIDRKFDEIIAFAEIERFLNTPVKRYSSGMYMRLAFAVAAHLEPEILLIDEVLAVGDVQFQKKCLRKMDDVAKGGRTVLFVSHNMGAVKSLCNRVIFLVNGKIEYEGDPHEAVNKYLFTNEEVSRGRCEVVWNDESSAPQCEELILKSVKAYDDLGTQGNVFRTDKPLYIEYVYKVKQNIRGMRVVLAMTLDEGYVAFSATDQDKLPLDIPPGLYRSTIVIPANLMNRKRYFISLSFEIPGIRYLIRPTQYLSVNYVHGEIQSSYTSIIWPGAVSPDLDWKFERIENEKKFKRENHR